MSLKSSSRLTERYLASVVSDLDTFGTDLYRPRIKRRIESEIPLSFHLACTTGRREHYITGHPDRMRSLKTSARFPKQRTLPQLPPKRDFYAENRQDTPSRHGSRSSILVSARHPTSRLLNPRPWRGSPRTVQHKARAKGTRTAKARRRHRAATHTHRADGSSEWSRRPSSFHQSSTEPASTEERSKAG